ncbi:MAG TPA: hypothetical protein DEP53_14755 [Bacteroidetes bacterium]|nr:hypothetical protein [Bacteroidota bacterium]
MNEEEISSPCFPKGGIPDSMSSAGIASSGNRIQPKEESAIENSVRYITRASFSQERCSIIPDEGVVVY